MSGWFEEDYTSFIWSWTQVFSETGDSCIVCLRAVGAGPCKMPSEIRFGRLFFFAHCLRCTVFRLPRDRLSFAPPDMEDCYDLISKSFTCP